MHLVLVRRRSGLVARRHACVIELRPRACTRAGQMGHCAVQHELLESLTTTGPGPAAEAGGGGKSWHAQVLLRSLAVLGAEALLHAP